MVGCNTCTPSFLFRMVPLALSHLVCVILYVHNQSGTFWLECCMWEISDLTLQIFGFRMSHAENVFVHIFIKWSKSDTPNQICCWYILNLDIFMGRAIPHRFCIGLIFPGNHLYNLVFRKRWCSTSTTTSLSSFYLRVRRYVLTEYRKFRACNTSVFWAVFHISSYVL